MELTAIATGITIAANVMLAILVFLHDQKSASNRAFVVMALSIIFWAIANLISITSTYFAQLQLARLVIFFALPMQFSFFIFAHTFPSGRLRIGRKVLWAYVLFVVSAMVLTMTSLVFKNLTEDGKIVPGSLIGVFAGTILFFFFGALLFAILRFRSATKSERQQWRFVLIGVSIMYSLLISLSFASVVLFGNMHFIPYAPLFTLPFLLLSAYAILRHNFLNVKVVSAEIFSMLIIFTLLLDLFTTRSFVEMFPKIITLGLITFLSYFLLRGVLHEVDSRREIERLAGDLRLANKRLRELDVLKSEFLSFASHQLRSPVTAIKGYASLILEGTYGKSSVKMHTAIDRIFQASNALALVIDDFLNISRIEQGKMKYDMSSVDVAELLQNIIQEQKPNMERATIDFSFSFEKKHTYLVYGDHGKLKQVFTNILDNNIKYATGKKVSVTLDQSESGSIRIAFKDMGVGIPVDVLPTLFEKYSRARTVRGSHVSGTGLGLFIARVIITAHHGTITAASPGNNMGSTFTIILPSLEEEKNKLPREELR